MHHLTLRALLVESGSVNQEAGNISDLEALVVVSVALELQLHQHEVRIPDHKGATSPHSFVQVLTHVVNGKYAEVVLTVNHQETGWNFGLLVKYVHHFGGNNAVSIFTHLQLADIDEFAVVLLGTFPHGLWHLLRNGPHHIDKSIRLNTSLVQNSVVGS